MLIKTTKLITSPSISLGFFFVKKNVFRLKLMRRNVVKKDMKPKIVEGIE